MTANITHKDTIRKIKMALKQASIRSTMGPELGCGFVISLTDASGYLQALTKREHTIAIAGQADKIQKGFKGHGRFLSINKNGCICQHDSNIIGLTGLEHCGGFQLRLIRGGCSYGDNAVFVEGLVGSHWCLSVWYGSIIPGIW